MSASAELSNVNTALVQKDGKFIPAERAIEWTVVVDTLGQGFKTLILIDTMENPYTHTPGSVTVNGASAATGVNQPVFDGSKMTLPLIVGGVPVYAPAQTYTIKYKTPIGSMDDYVGNTNPTNPKNDAWLEYDWLGGPGYGPSANVTPPTVGKGTEAASTPILKEAVSYNPVNRTITWKITVNPNCLNLTGVTVKDIIPDSEKHENLQYVADSLRVGGASAADPKVTGAGTSELTLSLPDLAYREATFRVTSVVNDGTFLGSNEAGAYPFVNTADLTATAELTSKTVAVTGHAEATIKPDNNILRKTAGSFCCRMR